MCWDSHTQNISKPLWKSLKLQVLATLYKTCLKIKTTYKHSGSHINLANASKMVPLDFCNHPQTQVIFTYLSAHPRRSDGVSHNCTILRCNIYNLHALNQLSVTAFLRYASSIKITFARCASITQGNTHMDSRQVVDKYANFGHIEKSQKFVRVL
jgi:hypothetical protein